MSDTQHRATPEQWQRVVSWKAEGSYCESCLLELRDRIEALENAANHPAKQDSSPAPAGGLVERVAATIINGQACDHDEGRTARAAILAVAGWLERERIACWAAHRLREEAR